MYWYKPAHLRSLSLLYVIIISGLYSCRPEVKESRVKFFDLKGYFHTDSARLVKWHPAVKKTVSHNGDTETKTIRIKNWGSEFSLFTSSDINKPAWRQSYTVTENDTLLKYQATDPELKTQEIIIEKKKSKVRRISIYNHTENFLYKNEERLFYYPDSLYRIEKTQQVRLLGKNTYKIEGLFY